MNVAVYCGSRMGSQDEFATEAEHLGTRLGTLGWQLVYGGGNVGLMGVVADGALKAGAHVTGIIPKALADREVAHGSVTELLIVEDMHIRKAGMIEKADAFVVLPGGTGTMEEFFEVWTWQQLGYHSKPCVVVNIAGYYDPLVAMIEHMVAQGFVSPAAAESLIVVSSAAEAIEVLDRGTRG